MSLSLLATKLYIPPARTDRVTRPRLLEKLRAGLERPGCFTLLTSPAGSGKTTLLSEFIAQQRRPVAWLSLDEGDNDPARFWSYLIAACRSALPGVGTAAQALLNESMGQAAGDALPTLLINDLAGQGVPLLLVLDDFHLIQNPEIQASCAFLVEHLPGSVYAVLATRTDPPWPLARYRARNRLLEIRAQDLRFTQSETAEFLNRSMGLDLSTENIAALEERTEGWAAGLQLAALALQGALADRGESDAETFVRAFAGSHVFVAEYLIEEVLKRQSEDTQAFMLQTSILGRMNAELCEALTGCADSQARLIALHKANVFVISLDDQQRWFRYHHLFADLLRAHLPRLVSAQAVAALHARAASWYEQAGDTGEAVEHALVAKDFEHAARLVKQAARTLIFSSQLNQLRRWLDALPEALFTAHPHLAIFRLYIDMIQGRLDVNPQTLWEKEQLIRAIPPAPENDPLRLELLAFLCRFVAFINPARAAQIANEVLAVLPEANLKLRTHIYSALCIAAGIEGDADRAEAAYRECRRLAFASGHFALLSHTTMIVAQGLVYFARLREAAGYCQEIIDLGKRPGQHAFYPAGHGYIGLAALQLEWNMLEEAEKSIVQGIELCRQGGLDGVFTGHALLARLKQARGDFTGALAELDYLDQTFQRKDFTVLSRRILIQLAMGDIASAPFWEYSLTSMLSGPPLPGMPKEAIQAILIRILLARGAIEQAAPLLDALQASAEQAGRTGRLIEVFLLRARMEGQQGKAAAALTHLERAIDLAAPEGFVLIFLEEVATLLPLLHALEHHPYARKLLCGYAKNIGEPNAFSTPNELVEPLTCRELEVLQCIAAGDSNQVIAERLVITVRTVKKHTGNIFGKLNVSSRTQAVAKARALGLLGGE